MNLVISSAWYPVCVATYLLRAARRAGHDVVTLGPTSGDSIPWEGNPTFPGFGVTPDIGLETGATVERILAAGAWCDVWIDVSGGWMMPGIVPARRRVGVATDPHVPGAAWGVDAMRPLCPEVFVMQSPYLAHGDGWLPYGFDPEWHAPQDVTPDADVTNLGAPYAERQELSAALTAAGLRVLGPGRGSIGTEYARDLCRAPVALVWPLADDLPARVFEALACGREVVTAAVPDLERCGLGDPALSDVADLVFTASREDVVGEVADRVHRERHVPRPRPRFVEWHSWDARLAQLLDGRLTP